MVAPRKTGETAGPAAPTAGHSDFLIKLPNLGTSAASVSRVESPSASSSSGSNTARQHGIDNFDLHPAFAELAGVGEEAPAAPSAYPPAPQPQRYIDQAHLRVGGSSVHFDEAENEPQYSTPRNGPHRARSGAPRTMSGDFQGSPQGWLSWLGNLNEAIAPFAGLIVTVALLTCVCLLFWLITDHRSGEFDLEQLGISDEGLSVEVLDLDNAEALPSGSNSLADVPTDQPQATTPTSAPTGGDEAPGYTTPTESEEQVPQLETRQEAPREAQQSAPAKLADSEPVPLGYLEYPRTSTPDPLAFERATASTDGAPPSLPRALPEVAEREDPTDNSLSR